MNRNELIKKFKNELKKVTKNVIIGDAVSQRIALSIEHKAIKKKKTLHNAIVKSIYSNCLFPLVRVKLHSGLIVEHVDYLGEDKHIYRVIGKDNVVRYIVVFMWEEVELGIVMRVQVSRT